MGSLIDLKCKQVGAVGLSFPVCGLQSLMLWQKSTFFFTLRVLKARRTDPPNSKVSTYVSIYADQPLCIVFLSGKKGMEMKRERGNDGGGVGKIY